MTPPPLPGTGSVQLRRLLPLKVRVAYALAGSLLVFCW